MMEERLKLSEREYRALEAVCEHGRQDRAAKALDIGLQTLKNHLALARARTNTISTVQLAYRLGAGEIDRFLPGFDDEGDEG